MAWRIEEQVVRGQIDCRSRGRIIGRIWLQGREEPVVLQLEGSPWRDLAGHQLRFVNRDPKPGDLANLADRQDGVVGDITASRKVRVPECSMEEFEELYAARKPFPWHWENSLYLEWFSSRNGRIVIESTDYELDLDPDQTWKMTETEEAEQRLANSMALTDFMDRLVTSAAGEATIRGEEVDADSPQSAAEAEADAEAERMNLLLDRVEDRLDREGHHDGNFETILEEERERMRRERGEPKEEPTPEEEAERAAWIEEINAACEETVGDMEAENWKGEGASSDRRHPLVERCSDLAVRLHHEVKEAGWIPHDAPREHPLIEIVGSTMSAGAKLAGALGMDAENEWPPPALFASHTLLRLKKARQYLRDVMRALDSADEENLASLPWRSDVRRETAEILGAAQEFIHEVRQVLADGQE